MKILDLITDPGTGQLSTTKLWLNVAYGSATFAFLKAAWDGVLQGEMWWAYLLVVGGHAAGSKLISLKYKEAETKFSEGGSKNGH